MSDLPTAPPTIRLADYRAPDWFVPEVALRFELDDRRTRVHSVLRVVRNGGHGAPLVLDGEDLHLISVAVDGVPVTAEVTPGGISLAIAGDSASVAIVVEVAPAANTVLLGLYASGGNLCTQCEAEGFRRITYFVDRPDVLSRYSVRLEADAVQYPVLLSNGEMVNSGPPRRLAAFCRMG